MEILETDPTPIRPELDLPLLAVLMSVKAPKGIRITPDLPERMLQVAARLCLRLEEGEVILGLADRSDSFPPIIDCVLTTRGVHYVHKRIKGSGDGINPALHSGLLAYGDLPTVTKAAGVFLPRIDFTEITKNEVQQLESLALRSVALYAKIESVPTRNSDLEAMKQEMSSAAKHQKSALDQLMLFGKTRQQSALTGPNGFVAANTASFKDLERFSAPREQYFRKYGLKPLEK